MRYFFNFETINNKIKFEGRELFYMRLLDKRMGRTYKLHRNKLELEHKSPPNCTLLTGYVIEFLSKEAFVKFKLGFRKLFNPHLEPAKYVNSVYSFGIDDNFIPETRKAYQTYLMDRERCNETYTQFSYIDHSIFSLTKSIEYTKTRILSKSYDENFDDISERVNNDVGLVLENYNELLKHLSVPNIDVSYIKNYDERYLENYKKCFRNLETHNM